MERPLTAKGKIACYTDQVTDRRPPPYLRWTPWKQIRTSSLSQAVACTPVKLDSPLQSDLQVSLPNILFAERPLAFSEECFRRGPLGVRHPRAWCAHCHFFPVHWSIHWFPAFAPLKPQLLPSTEALKPAMFFLKLIWVLCRLAILRLSLVNSTSWLKQLPRVARTTAACRPTPTTRQLCCLCRGIKNMLRQT